jgi:hypothetical protein
LYMRLLRRQTPVVRIEDGRSFEMTCKFWP